MQHAPISRARHVQENRENIDKPVRLSIMEYLFYAGDDRFGALGVSTSANGYIPRTGSPLPRLAQAQQLSEIIHKVSAKEPVNDTERKMLATGGSFGGAKPKALIEIAGEQWVIKFFNNEPIDVPLIEHASMTLAPADDVLTTNSGQGSQEFIVGAAQRDSTLSNAMSQCELFGYTPAQAAAEVVRVIKVVDGWRQHFAACGVTDADIQSLAERIDGDPLLAQRQGFNPADYASRAQAPRRRNPFAR